MVNLDHWARQLRYKLPQWLDISVDRAEQEDHDPGSYDHPPRHGINLKRSSDGQVLMTGLVRVSAEDTDAVEVASSETLYLLLPQKRCSTLYFFVCDEDLSIYRIDQHLPGDPLAPVTREVVQQRASWEELLQCLMHNLFVVGRTDGLMSSVPA